MAVRSLTVKERILLHLFDYNRYGEEYEVPGEVTQSGIAEAVGIRVQHVTQYVKPLISEGLVQERVSHIRGKSRRRKVYFLGWEGRQMVASLRRALLSRTVPVWKAGSAAAVPLMQVFQQERRGSSLLSLLGELNSTGQIVAVPESREPGLVDFSQEAPPVEDFYGREGELEQVLQSLEEAPVVVVTGFAGIGKTTLGSRICEGLRDARSLFWRRVRPWDSTADLARGLSGFLRALGRVALYRYLTGPGSKELGRIEEYLATDFSDLEALLILDDVHNASEDAEDFLSMLLGVLAQRDGPSALLLSRITPRFYGRRDVELDKSVREIPLGALDAKSGKAFLVDAGINETEADRLFRTSGGSPLFLRILARASSPDDLGKIGLTLETYIDEIIEPLLSEEERHCLEAASFYQVPVTARGLLLEPGGGRRTISGLQRKALLDRVDIDRFVLHDYLRSYFQDELSQSRKETLSDLVVSFMLEESESASDKGNPQDAIAFLENAVMVETEPARRVSSLHRLGEMRTRVGDYIGSENSLRMALAGGLEAKHVAADLVPVQITLAWSLRWQGRFDKAEHEIEAGLAALSPAPSLKRVELLLVKAAVAWGRRDIEGALEGVAEVMGEATHLSGSESVEAVALHTKGRIFRVDPSRLDPEEVLADLQESNELGLAAGNRQVVAWNHWIMAAPALALGRVDKAIEYLDRSLELSKEAGDLLLSVEAVMLRAWCLSECLGKYTEAEAAYQEAYELAKETAYPPHSVDHHRAHAHLCMRQGRYEEARESMDFYLTKKALEGGWTYVNDRVDDLALMARLCIQCGDQDSSERFIRDAQALTRGAPEATYVMGWVEGVLHASRGEARKADTSFQHALNHVDVPRLIGSNLTAGEFLLEYGHFLTSVGENDRAKKIYRRALKKLARDSLRPLELAARTALESLGSSRG